VNHRQAGIGLFVLACFARDARRGAACAGGNRGAAENARLAVPLAGIGQRLTSDVTSGRREDLDEAAASFTAREGADLDR
jgi:hypothetical protein